jgi:hypothetical protein
MDGVIVAPEVNGSKSPRSREITLPDRPDAREMSTITWNRVGPTI